MTCIKKLVWQLLKYRVQQQSLWEVQQHCCDASWGVQQLQCILGSAVLVSARTVTMPLRECNNCYNALGGATAVTMSATPASKHKGCALSIAQSLGSAQCIRTTLRKNNLLLLILFMMMIRMNVQIVFTFFKVRISRKQ